MRQFTKRHPDPRYLDVGKRMPGAERCLGSAIDETPWFPRKGIKVRGPIQRCTQNDNIKTKPLTEAHLLPSPISIGSYLAVPKKSLLFGFEFEVWRDDGELICGSINARRLWSGKVIDTERRAKITIAVKQKDPSGKGPSSYLDSEIDVSVSYY